MNEYKCFDVSIEKGVATVTLNRGEKLNTMIPAFWSELPKVVGEINSSGEAVGVAVAKLDFERIYEMYGDLPENTNFGIKYLLWIYFSQLLFESRIANLIGCFRIRCSCLDT